MGRAAELAQLEDALAGARAGRGQLVLLAGEPGIGKTRVAGEFVAAIRGAVVYWGRCWEGEGAPPFWPWVQIVRAYLRDVDPPTLQADVGSAAIDLVRVIPEIAARLPSREVEPASSSLGLQPEQERFRFFDGLTSLFKNVARRQPLVLVLDDLQWADTPSLLLLEFLVREIPGSALLVLGTYRDAEIAGDHPLRRTLGTLIREAHCRRLMLGGLAADEIARYVELSAGHQPSARMLEGLVARTEGNPLFLREIVHVLAGEGRLDDDGAVGRLALPAGVREAIARRVAPLPAACRQILGLAAVIGLDFDLTVLQTAAERVASDGDTPAALQAALAAGVIEDVQGTASQYTFGHVLIRETLYGDIPKAQRRQLHHHVATVLERLYTPAPDAHAAELTHHFAAAGVPGRALEFARRGGDHAMRRFAYEEAVRLYAQALALTGAQAKTDEHARCDLLVVLGEAELRSGDMAGSHEHLREAATLARGLGLAEQFGRAALGFAWSLGVGAVDQDRIALLEEALERLPVGDSILKARVMARLATHLHWIPDSHQGRTNLSSEAVAMARRLGDKTTLAFVLLARLNAMWGAGNAERLLPLSRELLRLAESAGDVELALQSRHWLVVHQLELGDIEGVDREIAVHASQARVIRQPLYLWYAGLWQAMRALLDGRFDDVEARCADAIQYGLRAESPTVVDTTLDGPLFWLGRERGLLANLVDVISANAAARGQVADSYACGLAFIYAEVGRHDDARGELARLSRRGFEKLIDDNPRGWDAAVAMAAEAAAMVEDTETAAALYPLMSRVAGRTVVLGLGTACFGSTDRYLGLLATVMQRWPDAERHFAAALRMHTGMRARPLTARTQCDWAKMLLARGAPGDREQALALLEAAIATARSLGMRSLLEKAEALQLQAPEPATAAPAATSAPSAAVTAVLRLEGEFWTLSCDGRTARLGDSKGLRYLARLVREPGREFHALDLSRDGVPLDRRLSDGRLDLLDAQAKAAYRQRLSELRQEVDEAEQLADHGRAEGARAEIEVIAEQLAAAVGLGGRDRQAASAAERARSTVTQRLRAAVRKVAEHHPTLGDHLARTVRTGTFCSYVADASSPVRWRVD